MKVEIVDTGVFERLDPAVVAKYLEANHWHPIEQSSSEMRIFEHANGEDINRVWLPLKAKYRDFASSMASAFRTIAETEGRSQLLLLEDLETTAVGDVIAVDTYDGLDHNNHTIPLIDGIIVHQQARQLALSGAWNAAIDKPGLRRSMYPTTPRSEITEFMSNLRLAQSGRQSYVVRIVSPLTEAYKAGIQLSFADMKEFIPFERRALLEMLRGLHMLRSVARDNIRRGKFAFESFDEAVPNGVNANLCDAVAPIGDISTGHPLQIGVSWCLSAPVVKDAPQGEVEFTPDALAYVRAAATEFRKRLPEDTSITGYVYSMRWQDDLIEGQGKITMKALIDTRWRSVRMMVSGLSNEVANDAYMKRKLVRVDGSLRQDGFRYWLDNPRNMHIEETAEDE